MNLIEKIDSEYVIRRDYTSTGSKDNGFIGKAEGGVEQQGYSSIGRTKSGKVS